MRDRQYDERHLKVAKYWKKKSHKMWAVAKRENNQDDTNNQYHAMRYLRRARRYRIRGLKRI